MSTRLVLILVVLSSLTSKNIKVRWFNGKSSKINIIRFIFTTLILILALIPLIWSGEDTHIGNYYFEDYKITNYSNVLIASKKSYSCSWKPDSIDDGYKQCSLEIIIWNKRDTSISVDMAKDKFDFKITKTIKDKLDFYYSTDFEIYTEERINHTTEGDTKFYYNVSKIIFNNWKELDNLSRAIPAGKIVGVKAEFELPKYSGASWNFTYTPLNILLDPDVSACGSLDTENATYNLTQNVSTTGTCFTITAKNVTLDCKGYTINYSSDGGNNEYGVYSTYDFTTVKNCIIKEGLAAGDVDYGIYFSGAENGTIDNNTITTLGISGHGIYFFSNSNSNTLSNNTITTSGDDGYGIYLYSSSTNTLSNNTITTSGSTGIGIYLELSSNSNTLSTNTITTSGDYGYGMFIYSNTNNNSFSGMNIKTSNLEGYSVYIYETNHNFTISNSILNSSKAGVQEFYIGNGVISGKWNFTNVTRADGSSINISWIASANGTLNMKWWLTTNVTDGINPMQANITIYDKNSNLVANLTTDTNGYLKQDLLEYDNINNTLITYYSNYTVNTTKTGYLNNSQSVNISTNRLLSIVLTSVDIIPPSFSSNKTNASSTTYNGTDVQINLTITDGTAVDFYRLIVNDTSDGVWLNQTLTDAGGATSVTPVFNYSIYNFTTSGGTMGWRVWANDTLGYSGVSDIYTFNVMDKGLISSCQDLTNANYVYSLNQSVNTIDTCFSIQANNITLDCKGYEINYSSNGGNSEYGVYSAYNFTTIKNCNIVEGLTAGTTDYAIYFIRAKNGTIDNNTITTSGINGYGISLTLDSNSNTLSTNTITTSGDDGYGIYLLSNSNSNTLSNNTITTSAGTGRGIVLQTSSKSNTLSSNTITTSGYGIYLFSNSNSNTLSSNTITTSGSSGYGIYLSSNSNNNSFSGMNIKTSNSSGYSVYIYDTNHNFTITDSVLNSSYAGVQELYVANVVTGGEWNFTNVTRADGNRINISWIASANGTLNMKWWLTTNVTDGINPMQANITIYDKNSNLVANLTTDTNGYLKQDLLEYMNVNNTATTYYSNYTVNASRTGYLVNSQSVNMSTNRLLSIVFSMPFFSGWQNNASSNTYRYGSVNFSINISDNVGLSSYMFAHNQSGILTNVSNGSISGKSKFLNYTLNITLRKNNYICGQYWANSTSGSANQTNLSCFIVQNALPLLKTDLQFRNSTAGHNFTVNVTFTDWDNASDFVSKTIENSTGQCAYQSNITLEDDINLIFNCTGTALTSTIIRINATDGSGITINSSQLTTSFPNKAPTMTSTELNKTSGVVNTDDLNCSAVGKADVDGDTTTYHYEWYNNSVAKGYDDVRLLNTNLTGLGDWYCEAWADDTYANSSKYTSSSVTIGSSQVSPTIVTANATTTITGINSTATNPTNNNSWVNLSVLFTDADNDAWTGYFCTTPTWSNCRNNVSGSILCKSENNLTSKTLSCMYNVSGYTSTNPLTWYAFVLDNTSKQSTSASSTFEVNYPEGEPSSVYPSNNIYINTNYTMINWTASGSGLDSSPDTINYTLYINSSTYNYTLFYNGTNTYFNFTNATTEYETYNWRIYTFDEHGYGYHNITLGNFTTDWTNPVITITQPTGTKSSRVNILARWNASDLSPLTSCHYSVGRTGTTDEIANTSISCSANSVNLTVTLDANFNFYLTVNDSAGNKRVGSSSFSVDTSSPPSPPSSGGGFKQIKESQIIEAPPLVELPSLCGDGVCDEGESPWDCPRDCFKKVFDFNDIFCLPLGRCGNWEESWFINILVLLTLSFLTYFMFLRKPGRLR